MASDPNHEDKTELAGRARAAKVISNVILAVGGITAIAQLVDYIQSGKFNLILSAISALMLAVGIIVLFTLKKRRSALMGAAIMLAIILFAVGAIFFARPSESGSFATPISGQRVNGKDLFSAGNVEGISSTLLCIVKDSSGNYFPYPTQNAHDRWSATVGIGPPNINRPLPFTLILATAIQSTVDEFHIREQADPDYNSHGLGPNFPRGIEVLAEVEIIRAS